MSDLYDYIFNGMGTEFSFCSDDETEIISKQKKGCVHFSRNVGQSEVEKRLKKHGKGSPLKCEFETQHCHKFGNSDEIQAWMCLGCGVIACGPPCTYGTHMHQHVSEMKGKHTLVIELGSFQCWCRKCKKIVEAANTLKFKMLLGKIKQCFSTSQPKEEKFIERAQMRCYSSNDSLDDPHQYYMNKKALERSAKLSLQDKCSVPSTIPETDPASPELAVPAVPKILVIQASPETVPDSPTTPNTSATVPDSTTTAILEREVPVVAECADPSVTSTTSEMPRQRMLTPIRVGSPNSPAVVTSWGSPEKTRRRTLAEPAPPASTFLTVEAERSPRNPAVALPEENPLQKEVPHNTSHALHFQPPEDNTVPHQTPHIGLTNDKSSYPSSMGKKSGKSQRFNLGNKLHSNGRREKTAKKNLMKAYGDQTKTPDWRKHSVFAKVNDEMRAERERKVQAANGKRKPRQKGQERGAGTAAEKTTETSRSEADTCEESCVQPEAEVVHSKPMTRGATHARRRAITSYGEDVVMVKAVFNAACNNNEALQVNGLVNVGVTCFLNATLQCLAQSPQFLHELIRTFDEQTVKLAGDPSKGAEALQVILNSWGPVTHNLAQVLANVPTNPSLDEPIKTDVLVNVLDQNTNLNFKHQQDAQELLITLFDILREEYELKLHVKIEEAIQHKFTSKEGAARALKIYEQQAQKEATFVPTSLFQGLATSTVSCDTLRKSEASLESFTTLSLPIAPSRKRRSVDQPLSPTKRSMGDENVMQLCEREKGTVELVEEEMEDVYTLQSCLQQFMASQCMTDYNCACKKRSGGGIHTIQTKIMDAPKFLVLHLKRFRMDDKNDIKKINTPVSFPSLLDITEFCDAKCRGSGTVVYSLYAVLHHSGTPTGGHYVADVKVRHPKDLAIGVTPEESQWFVMNDEVVTKTSENSVLQRQAYLLFYEKID